MDWFYTICILISIYFLQDWVRKTVQAIINSLYPVYSPEEINFCKVKRKEHADKWEELRKKKDDYIKQHEKELQRGKYRKDLPKEFVDIEKADITEFTYEEYHIELMNKMKEANYLVRSGRKTINEVVDEISNILIVGPDSGKEEKIKETLELKNPWYQE